MNENLGDLPTLVAEQAKENDSEYDIVDYLVKLEHFKNKYDLSLGLNENQGKESALAYTPPC